MLQLRKIFIFCFLLSIPIVTAQNDRYSINDTFYLYHLNDSILYTNEICYLTIRNATDDIILDRINLTDLGDGRFNFTLNSSLNYSSTDPYYAMANCSDNSTWKIYWQKFYMLKTKVDIMSYELAVPITFVLTAFAFGYLAIGSKKHGALQLLFLGIMFGSIYTSIATLVVILDSYGETSLNNIISSGLSLYTYGFAVVMAYFMIVYMYKLLTKTAKAGNEHLGE